MTSTLRDALLLIVCSTILAVGSDTMAQHPVPIGPFTNSQWAGGLALFAMAAAVVLILTEDRRDA